MEIRTGLTFLEIMLFFLLSLNIMSVVVAVCLPLITRDISRFFVTFLEDESIPVTDLSRPFQLLTDLLLVTCVLRNMDPIKV